MGGQESAEAEKSRHTATKGRTSGADAVPTARGPRSCRMPAEMTNRPETNAGGTGGELGSGQQADPARKGTTGEKILELMEQVVCRENVVSAHARVVRNKGAPGVDGMTVDGLMPYCRKHWTRIREE